MTKLTLSLAGVDYDRTRALFGGFIEIEGCSIVQLSVSIAPFSTSPEEAFHRANKFQEFAITKWRH